MKNESIKPIDFNISCVFGKVTINTEAWEKVFNKNFVKKVYKKTDRLRYYKEKYKWQRLIPFWLLRLFIKPTTFHGVKLKGVKDFGFGGFERSIPINFKEGKNEK